MPKSVPDLRIARGFTLPPQAVTQTFAIMARRGAGKTTTSGVMVEEMVKAGLPTCVVDPSAHRSIAHDAPRPHGVLHVVSEVATWGAAALLHGSVAATARVARLFGVKVP